MEGSISPLRRAASSLLVLNEAAGRRSSWYGRFAVFLASQAALWFYTFQGMRSVNPEARLVKLSEPLWWGLAAFLSLCSLRLPKYIDLKGDLATATLVTELALFASGAAIGAFRPYRLWRWPLATLVALTVYDLAVASQREEFAYLASEQIWALAFRQCAEHMLHAIAVLVGACIGARLSHAGLD